MSASSVGMSDLSDEILLCILRHVPLCDLVMNVSNVCIKLHTLCYDKTLLSKVSLSDEYQVNHFELMRRDCLSEDIYLSFTVNLQVQECVYNFMCALKTFSEQHTGILDGNIKVNVFFFSSRLTISWFATYWNRYPITCNLSAWMVATGWMALPWSTLVAAGEWRISMSPAVASP